MSVYAMRNVQMSDINIADATLSFARKPAFPEGCEVIGDCLLLVNPRVELMEM